MRPAALIALLLVACLALVACGGDDEPERADTAPATAPQTVPEPATVVEPEPDTAPGDADAVDPEDQVTRADAAQETARQSMLVAEDVPNSDLYFAGADDVECTSPDASQPDNANERASEWTCTIDAETNGVACEGTARIVAAPGENEGTTFEGLRAEDVDIDCRPA